MHFRFLSTRLIGLAIAVAPRQAHQSHAQSPIVGTWELLVFESRDSLRAVSYPLGKRPKGILIHSQDGRVAVQLFDPDRPRFASDDRATGTDAEIRAAFNGSFAYYGRYSIDSARAIVTHRIEGASF